MPTHSSLVSPSEDKAVNTTRTIAIRPTDCPGYRQKFWEIYLGKRFNVRKFPHSCNTTVAIFMIYTHKAAGLSLKRTGWSIGPVNLIPTTLQHPCASNFEALA